MVAFTKILKKFDKVWIQNISSSLLLVQYLGKHKEGFDELLFFITFLLYMDENDKFLK